MSIFASRMRCSSRSSGPSKMSSWTLTLMTVGSSAAGEQPGEMVTWFTDQECEHAPPPEENQYHQPHPEPRHELMIDDRHLRGQYAAKDMRAVQRVDRDQVEVHQPEVHQD